MGLAVVADAAGASRPVSPADSASAASSRLNRGWLARTLMTASLLRYPIPSLGGGAGALRGCARGLVIEGGRMSKIGRARLNSSHQIISYAVFCLKKKKNMTTRPQR